MQTYADSSFKYWKTQSQPKVYSDRIKKIEGNIKSLNLDKIKDVVALTKALKKLDDIQKETKLLSKEIKGQHKAVKQTFDEMQLKLKTAKNGLSDDIKRAQQLAKLKDLDVKDISMLLFGEPIVNKIEKMLGYVAMGRKYLPKAKKAISSEKEEKPSRFKGQNIRFPFHYRYPEFLLRKTKLSAATAAGDTSKAYFAEGTITGLTNEPAVFGTPTRFNINLKKVSGNQYDISGSLDHTTNESRDSVWVTAKNFALGEVKLKPGKYFPHTVDAKKGDIFLAGFFIDDTIDIKFKLDTEPVKFLFEKKATDKIAKVVRNVLENLNHITLNANLKGDKSDYKLNMNSNVDKLLAGQVRKTMKKNLRQAQQRVEKYVRKEADKYRLKVEAQINKNKKTLLEEMNKVKQKAQDQLDDLDKRKKEVEQRIEDEKKKAGDKAKKTLEGLFKKKKKP